MGGDINLCILMRNHVLFYSHHQLRCQNQERFHEGLRNIRACRDKPLFKIIRSFHPHRCILTRFLLRLAEPQTSHTVPFTTR